MTDPTPDPAGAYADPLQGNDAGPEANPFVSDSGATDTASAGTESVGAGVDGSPVEADSPDVTATSASASSTPTSDLSDSGSDSALPPTTDPVSTVPADAPTTGADASDPGPVADSTAPTPSETVTDAGATGSVDGSAGAGDPSTAGQGDAVDSTESTSPSSETPSGDTEVTSAYQADPEIAPNDGGAVESTAPTPSDGASGAEPSAPTDTPIYDSIVGDGADPSTSPSEQDSSSSDSSTSPENESGPTSPDTSSPEDDRAPLDPPVTDTADAAAAPLDHDQHIDPAPETAPETATPAVDESGDTLETGPGVEDDVSLSPTADGGFTSDEEQDEPSTEPHITTPHEQDEEDAHFGTPIRPLIEQSTTGYTPRFRATRRASVIEVQRADWIGPEVLTVDVDDIDELIGLLEGLRDTDLG